MQTFTANRRSLIKSMALAPLASSFRLKAESQKQKKPPLLFSFCANGGASIIDSFMPAVSHTENKNLRAYPESLIDSIPDSPIRCVKNLNYSLGIPVGPKDYSMKQFLQSHYRDMLIMSQEVTSVNHLIAAKRSLTGNGTNRGRTLAEEHAAQLGDQFILPNINMAIGGYAENGDDDSLPERCRSEIVVDGSLFALSTHGYRQTAQEPEQMLMQLARETRNQLSESWLTEALSQPNAQLRSFLSARKKLTSLEKRDLFDSLNLIPNHTVSGASPHPNDDVSTILQFLPDLFENPISSKIALSYLLAKNQVTGAMTISLLDSILFEAGDPPERIVNLPLGFDWSHNNHQGTQNTMWRIMLQGIDALIKLLKQTQDGPDASTSLWDRSLIYVATEFGRSKELTTGSGHHLNNGTLLISPLLRGNQVLGGLDETSLQSRGFDFVSGKPHNGRPPREGDVYSLICQALGLDFPGRSSIPIAFS